MLIDCSYCQSRVDASVLGEDTKRSEYGPELEKIMLLKCPACSKPLLGGTMKCQIGPDEFAWIDTIRLWPEPENQLNGSMPADIRSSLSEAKTCFRARAFSACAVMCGRAMEAMCVAHTSKTSLEKGLAALLDSGVIDARLWDWGDSLRKERNIGAHATGQTVNVEDAKDVLEFATAICEYVYVLSDRYDRYRKRKAKPKE